MLKLTSFHVSQFGLDSCAVSAIGKDDLGSEIVRTFEESGLDFVLEEVDFPTGTVQVELDEAGVPSYIITENVAWDNIPFSERLCKLAENCGAVDGYVFTRDEESRIDTPKVNVVSTVGVGDSFTGTFVAALLKGVDIRTAHELAVRVSAFVCTQTGAMPDLSSELKSQL